MDRSRSAARFMVLTERTKEVIENRKHEQAPLTVYAHILLETRLKLVSGSLSRKPRPETVKSHKPPRSVLLKACIRKALGSRLIYDDGYPHIFSCFSSVSEFRIIFLKLSKTTSSKPLLTTYVVYNGGKILIVTLKKVAIYFSEILV